MHPFRKNVGIIVFNKDKKILVCERAKRQNLWQMPQGGIDDGEDVISAAKRELFEETGIKSIKIIEQTKKPTRYVFPEYIRDSFLKKNPDNINMGQDQHWVLAYFYGEDSEINLKKFEPIEFKNFKWETIDFAIKNIVYFKKNVYTKAFKELKPFIDDFEDF